MKRNYLFRSSNYRFTVCAAPSEQAAREFLNRVYPSIPMQFVGEDTRSKKERLDSFSIGIITYKVEGQQ